MLFSVMTVIVSYCKRLGHQKSSGGTACTAPPRLPADQSRIARYGGKALAPSAVCGANHPIIRHNGIAPIFWMMCQGMQGDGSARTAGHGGLSLRNFVDRLSELNVVCPVLASDFRAGSACHEPLPACLLARHGPRGSIHAPLQACKKTM